jgi:hypothetical protein
MYNYVREYARMRGKVVEISSSCSPHEHVHMLLSAGTYAYMHVRMYA